MLEFLVLVLVTAVSCEHFGESGLHFDYNTEYAPKYDNYEPRDYHFNYAVSDPHTGDHKSQWEVRHNGVIRGGYSLLEPDGTTRLVEYIADDHGFRAVVKKLGVAIHPDHIETHNQELPIIAQPRPEIAHYRTYDGQIDNYANLANVEYSIPSGYIQPTGVAQSVNLHANQPIIEPVSYHVQPQLVYQPQPVHLAPTQPIYHPQPIQPASVPANEVHHIQNILSQPEAVGYIEGISQGQFDEKIALPQPALPLGPISPSYHTTIEYHGLTGNPEDDSRYVNYEKSANGYGYHAEYSQKVQKIIPAPESKRHHDIKHERLIKKPFLIYYPESDSN